MLCKQSCDGKEIDELLIGVSCNIFLPSIGHKPEH